jgi:TolC family type I secretion outer membrane protein
VLLALAVPPARAQPLAEALAAAYLHSPDLRAARHALNVVNERRPQALAGWLPTITTGASAQRVQNNAGPDTATRTGSYTVNNALTLPITRGGGEYPALRSAEQAIRAQRALLLASEQVVLGQAAQAYLDLLLQKQLLRFRRDNAAALKRTHELILRQMAVGDRTAVDAGLAEARLRDAETQVAQARGALAVARTAYRQFIGRDPERQALPRPLSALPPTLEEAVRLAEAASPDVVAARYQLLAADAEADVSFATLLPSLALQVTDVRGEARFRGTPYAPDGRLVGTTVALVLSVPLFQGGAEYAQVRASRKTVLQRREELAATRLRAVAAATTAWQQRETAAEVAAGYAATLAANERLASRYQRQAEAGESTILEVLNGLQDLVNAQVNKATADRDRALADFTLLGALGGLTARTLGLNVPYYDPEGDYRRTRWRIWGLSVEE